MAKALAAAGAEIVCAARTQAQIDETVAEITAAGGRAIAVATDVTDSSAVNDLVAACLSEYGKIDVMVANAGGGGGSNAEFWEYADEDFDAVLATNLKSAFYCGRAAAKAMVERDEDGVLINVASGTALRGNTNFAYPAAKGGVISLTKSEATMLWRHGIRANVIVPGYVSQRPAADEEGGAGTPQPRPVRAGAAAGRVVGAGSAGGLPRVGRVALHHRRELHHRWWRAGGRAGPGQLRPPARAVGSRRWQRTSNTSTSAARRRWSSARRRRPAARSRAATPRRARTSRSRCCVPTRG